MNITNRMPAENPQIPERKEPVELTKRYGRMKNRKNRLTALLLAFVMTACLFWDIPAHAEDVSSSAGEGEKTSAVSESSGPAASPEDKGGAQSEAETPASSEGQTSEAPASEKEPSEEQASEAPPSEEQPSEEAKDSSSEPEKEHYELEEQELTADVYTDEARDEESDDGTVITVKGELPEGASVEAYPVEVEDFDGEKVLAAYDITIYGPDGGEFQPEDPVQVSISAPELKNADSVDIYHLKDAGDEEDDAEEEDADRKETAAEEKDEAKDGGKVADAGAERDDADEDREKDAEEAGGVRARVELDGDTKALNAAKVAANVKPKNKKVRFQAESFSIYVVTAKDDESAGTENSRIAVNGSIAPCYIKMDTRDSITVKANVRDIPTEDEEEVENATVSWSSDDENVVTVLPDETASDDDLSSSATFTAGDLESLDPGETAETVVTVKFYTLSHENWNNGKCENKWNDWKKETAKIHVTVQKHSEETGSTSDEVKNGKTVVRREGGNDVTSSGDPIYDLSLNFSGTEQTFTKDQDVDVVFVVDVSKSMEEETTDKDENGKPILRIEAAKQAVQHFQNLAGPETRNNPDGKGLNARYALVCFSGDDGVNRDSTPDEPFNDAMIQQGWTGSTGDDFTGKIEIGNGTVDGTVDPGFDGFVTGTGTNYEAGLMLADSLIANDHSSAKKLVIFLSDGVPTFRYDWNGFTEGTGYSYEWDNLNQAEQQLRNMKPDNAEDANHADYFFAVGCGGLNEHVSGNTTGKDILKGLTGAFGYDWKEQASHVLLASDSTSLSQAFADILNSTTTVTCKDVIIVDALSENIEIYNPNNDTLDSLVQISVLDKDGQEVQKEDDKDGKDFEPNISYTTDESGQRILTVSLGANYTADPDYTYKVTYPIVASDTAKDAFAVDGENAYDGTANTDTGTYAEQSGFFTNDIAKDTDNDDVLDSGTYVSYQKVDERGNVEGTQHLAYPMPVICGARLTLKKTDDSGNFLIGSSFTLYVKNSDGDWISVGNPLAITEKKGVTISGLVNGYYYKLVETKVPEGYLKADDIYFRVWGNEIEPTDEKDSFISWPKDVTLETNNTDGPPGRTLTVVNHKAYTLPKAGGSGTLPFQIIGTVILLGAAAGLGFWLYRNKKKKGAPPKDSS